MLCVYLQKRMLYKQKGHDISTIMYLCFFHFSFCKILFYALLSERDANLPLYQTKILKFVLLSIRSKVITSQEKSVSYPKFDVAIKYVRHKRLKLDICMIQCF